MIFLNWRATSINFHEATSDDFTTSGVTGGGNHMEDVGMVCPVCLAIPEDQIFNCVQCDNMLAVAARKVQTPDSGETNHK